MRSRGLVRVTAVCNALVLAAGLAVAAVDLARRPSVVFGGVASPAASSPAGPDSEPGLPAAGDDERPAANPDARRVDLPRHELDYLPPVARSGVLDGDPDLDGGCVWIEMDGQPHAVRWPGYEAGFLAAEDGGHTFELIDAGGRVVARRGATVWFTGARSGGSERLERCHVGAEHVWYVDLVGTDPPE